MSPLQPELLVVATSDNFGIVGKGKVVVLQMPPGPAGGPMRVVKSLNDSDAIFDIT